MSRRQRGVVLTDRGKQRLEAAIASAQDQEKYGARFTQTELEDRAGLSIKTIKKICHQAGPADQSRVEGLFSAFNLTLEPADYGWPQPDADDTLQPVFDVAAYRKCLQANYGYLKLYTLDSTDRADNIKLWSMFIEQTVREALPPSRYELPLDLKRQLQDEDALGEDLSAEALDYYRREYFQQPACKVLAAVAVAQRCVVLGDPGAGKSTLLQYLGLEWVENDAADLPLLIELREYALAESANFLEFLHRGRGVDWQFDPTVLHDYLTQHATLVMFDGLDEVFDRATQAAIIDDIIRFAQQYPLAKILVTSRIIGYNPERLQHAEFRHFTIQPLDDGEVDEFIERWYDLAMGSDADKVRLKQRLREAIASSKAIQNLADNPLLLTMMAILNRRQELPRDRADLYDQASRVLLYHWDVDHKRLQLPMDAIGRREKQEILRLVAYEMQAGEDGLKGNLISANRLTQILTEYLREQGFSEPREKANGLIHQLRHRNFILCDRGADTYGFVHRTFLEYFCAVEIVNRFEKQRTLSFEQLRDEVFGLHWQDEPWHEVLRLICGMIDATFSEEIIQSLLTKEIDRSKFLIREPWGQKRLQVGGFLNLMLASDCLSEVKNVRSISKIQFQVIEALKNEIENYEHPLSWDSANALTKRVSKPLGESLSWLKGQVESNKSSFIQCAAVGSVAASSNNEEIFHWLKELAINGSDWGIRVGAVDAISAHPSCKSSEIFDLLKYLLKNDSDWGVRRASVQTLSKNFSGLPEAFNLLCQVTQNDPFSRNHAEQDKPSFIFFECSS
ncbi:NACHT domain-containing protein [Phormidium tenue]|uniref:NACHT domain-containing protein n=1 Tax=Phormidium tenue TaxID=126344 RepID=UPI0009FED713|nr:NACHT domain-containing protein [Phormidium tenue]MBD2234602.1 HEAT repeat domain-containing protein [Phormidium tenue FACHB-1052]